MSHQKQYSDLFALAAEDDTSSVSRRGERGRGRKPASSKKEANNSMGMNKKNQEASAATVYSSEEDSEVSILNQNLKKSKNSKTF